MYNIFKVLGLRTVKSHGRVTSYIFVKEREGSSEKILKYVNCTYGSIPGSSKKNKFMIYACTIAGGIKTIERERYVIKISYIFDTHFFIITNIRLVHTGQVSVTE